MKLVSSATLLLLTGLALAYPPVVLAPDSASSAEAGAVCCSPSSDVRRNVYVTPTPSEEGKGKAHGRVVFDGEIPKRKELSITEAQSKGCVQADEAINKQDLTLLVGEDKGIANAVVTIAVPDQELNVPEENIVLDQVQCRFDQHIVLAPLGATVEYRNSDDVPHNVHTYSLRNKAFNRTLSAQTSYEQALQHAEVIQIRCDIHPWMSAYVFVADSNFATITDEHGGFEISGLAPGEYTAKIWHEKLGKTEVKVVVSEEGESEAVSVPMKLKVKRSRRRR